MHADRPQVACLGEAIVDLICERSLARGEVPDRFIPWPGGALANVAVAIARSGTPASLVGGVGSDALGRWLARGLEAEGVSTEWLATVPGTNTPVALIEFDPENEPGFQVYGEHIGAAMAAISRVVEAAIGCSQAIVVGSNTMVGETEREVTRQAVGLARSAGLPVLFDPNFRPNRWVDEREAHRYCRELIAISDLVKLNRAEAEMLTGSSDPVPAAGELAKMGPDLVVVTAGPGRIVTAGAASVTFTPERVETVSPLGAGDAFMGGMAASLARRDWDFGQIEAVLPEAAAAAARVLGGWGAQ